jgi:hypothetical protein
MAGRVNFQTASYQCIRPGELWQCNWLEETGTICSLVYDIPNKRISTLLAFSQGHWECAEEAVRSFPTFSNLNFPSRVSLPLS